MGKIIIMRIQYLGNGLYAVTEVGSSDILFTGSEAECEEYITINQN
jgi:hypothetical protein